MSDMGGTRILGAVVRTSGVFVAGGILAVSATLVHGYLSGWTYSPTRYDGIAGGFRSLFDIGAAFFFGGLVSARLAWLSLSCRYRRERRQRLPGGELTQPDVILGAIAVAVLVLLVVVANFG